MKKNLFRKVVNKAAHLNWKAGLGAIKRGEGRGQITAADTDRLLGSADIDGDCTKAFPNDARWDYVIGIERSKKAVAHFIEVHSAETSEVSKLEDKLDWLLEYLQAESQMALAALRREIHWVASGGINIPKHTPQYRKLNTHLRKKGLKGPVKSIVLI